MIRSFTRTLCRFLAAIVLLALLLCAGEVALRWQRFKTSANGVAQLPSLRSVVQPDKTTWLRVTPLLQLEMPVSSGEQTLLETNEFGLRGPTVSLSKPPNQFRVLCIGGSGVFGLGQHFEQTLPFQLQKLFDENGLGHVEFMNAGCPGSAPLTNLLRLRQRLLALKPDLVLYCVTPEDVSLDLEVRGGLTLDEDGKPAYATHAALDGVSSDEIDRLCQEFATAELVLSHLPMVFGHNAVERPVERSDAEEAVSLEPFVTLWQCLEESNSRFMISIIPQFAAGTGDETSDRSFSAAALEKDLHEIYTDHAIASIRFIHNPSPFFAQLEDPDTVFEAGSGKLSPEGNTLYARTIANAMAEFFPEVLTIPQTQPKAPNSPIPREQRARNPQAPSSSKPSGRPSVMR